MKAAALLALIAGSIVCAGAIAGTGSDVLEDVRNDARRNAENAARQAVYRNFPYNGSLYGLPGQTQSSSIREAAIRGALGGMFGSCQRGGLIDISNGGLNMQVGNILANAQITVPEVNVNPGHGGGARLGGVVDLESLIPTPTEVKGNQVKVGGTWMPVSEYNHLVAETRAELIKQQGGKDLIKQQGGKKDVLAKPKPEAQQSSAKPSKPAVSTIWGPAK